MTAPRALVPVERTTVPLGTVARPAGGRPMVDRFAFAACTDDAVAEVGQRLGVGLALAVGPTRGTAVVVQTARGDEAVTATLLELSDRGQSADVLLSLREGYDVIADQAGPLGLGAVLVIAHCAVLWSQPARLVGLS